AASDAPAGADHAVPGAPGHRLRRLAYLVEPAPAAAAHAGEPAATAGSVRASGSAAHVGRDGAAHRPAAPGRGWWCGAVAGRDGVLCRAPAPRRGTAGLGGAVAAVPLAGNAVQAPGLGARCPLVAIPLGPPLPFPGTVWARAAAHWR